MKNTSSGVKDVVLCNKISISVGGVVDAKIEKGKGHYREARGKGLV